MSSKSKIALAVAILLGTASASVSATKHSVYPVHHRHQAVAQHHVPPPTYAYRSFGFVRVPAPGYMEYQTTTYREGNY
jgi:hypothetical protein